MVRGVVGGVERLPSNPEAAEAGDHAHPLIQRGSGVGRRLARGDDSDGVPLRGLEDHIAGHSRPSRVRNRTRQATII